MAGDPGTTDRSPGLGLGPALPRRRPTSEAARGSRLLVPALRLDRGVPGTGGRRGPLEHRGARGDGDIKLFTDARGWLAHAHSSTLFLRKFPDLTLDQAAPRQAEVEMYFDADRDYIELENQGAYVTLAAGAEPDLPRRMALPRARPRCRPTESPPSCSTRSTPCSIGAESSSAFPRDRGAGDADEGGLTTRRRRAILDRKPESALRGSPASPPSGCGHRHGAGPVPAPPSTRIVRHVPAGEGND